MKFADIHRHLIPVLPDEIAVRNLNPEDTEGELASPAVGFFSVGVHPCYLENLQEDWFEKLSVLGADPRIVMIGECGFDRNSDSSTELQTEIFEKHLLLSENLSKPMIIHCVGRFNELIALRKIHQPTQKWIIHGFRGKPSLAEQLLCAGCDISFGARWNAESVKRVPAERLYVETDESAKPVAEIYNEIAAIKGCKPADLTAGSLLLNC